MGHQRFDNPWAAEGRGQRRGQRGDRRSPFEPGFGSGPRGGGGRGRRGERPGPPPWVAGLFGLDQGERRRGPRVRRGDVRSAILDVLRAAGEREEQLNGYQVIQQIADRSGEAWRPSPGSVYPTVQQLLDEGLVVADDDRGRRTLGLTAEGTTYVEAHADELAAVWRPFEDDAVADGDDAEPDHPDHRHGRGRRGGRPRDLRPEIGQVMGAVWQIHTAGSPQQREAAAAVLVDTRRRLYGLLADGDEPTEKGDDRDD